MSFIYRIVNNINHKTYIGKTETSIEERWKKHVWDANNLKENSKIHSSIKKYGKENFSIEVIEECSSDIINEREKYYIKKYNTVKDGYNISLGGKGNPLYNKKYILDLWKQGKTQKEISEIIGCERHTIYRILKNFKVPAEETIKNKYGNAKKKTAMIDKDTNEIIKIFDSATEAAKFFNKDNSSFINQVCKGKKKTAYGYKWEYIKE